MQDPARQRFSSTQAYRPLRPPETVEDKDACGIYASVDKAARPTHDAVATALVALEKMLHRAGNVDGEGDGCGVLIDIPRGLWAEEVGPGPGHDERFAVAHVLIPRGGDPVDEVQDRARALMADLGLDVRAERQEVVDSTALGPTAREEEPVFWQVAGLVDDPGRCFELTLALEERFDVHVASCSTSMAVYKVLGAPAVLGRYYPDLRDPRTETVSCSGTTATPPTPGPRSGAFSPSGFSATTGRSTRSPACARRRGCSGLRSRPTARTRRTSRAWSRRSSTATASPSPRRSS